MASVSLWLVWGAAVLFWTVGLLIPTNHQGDWEVGEFVLDRHTIASKLVHVAIYTVLTAFAMRLPGSIRTRFLAILFLAAHASVSEVLQKYCSNRTGTLEDVALDHFGILIGMLLSWRSWQRP